LRGSSRKCRSAEVESLFEWSTARLFSQHRKLHWNASTHSCRLPPAPGLHRLLRAVLQRNRGLLPTPHQQHPRHLCPGPIQCHPQQKATAARDDAGARDAARRGSRNNHPAILFAARKLRGCCRGHCPPQVGRIANKGQYHFMTPYASTLQGSNSLCNLLLFNAGMYPPLWDPLASLLLHHRCVCVCLPKQAQVLVQCLLQA